MYLKELPFGDIDLYKDRERQWSFYAITDGSGVCQVEQFLGALGGKLQDTGVDMLAFLDGMVFEPEGPRRWIGTKRCHESVANERIFEFIIGDLRVHWFYGADRSVVVLAVGAVKKGRDTPKQLKRQLIGLRDEYIAAHTSKQLVIVNV